MTLTTFEIVLIVVLVLQNLWIYSIMNSFSKHVQISQYQNSYSITEELITYFMKVYSTKLLDTGLAKLTIAFKQFVKKLSNAIDGMEIEVTED